MTRGITSENAIEAIIESVITRSLTGGHQQDSFLDIHQRHFQEEDEDNSMEVSEDVVELTELVKDLTALLLDLQAMEERLATTRIRSQLYNRRRRGGRSFEGESGRSLRRERLETGLERSRQRRLNRYFGFCKPSNICRIFFQYSLKCNVMHLVEP